MVRLRKSTRCASTLSLDRVPKRKRLSVSLKPTIKKPTLAARSVPVASGSNSHPAKPRGRPPKKPDAAAALRKVGPSANEQPDGDETADAPAGLRGDSNGRPRKNFSDVAATQCGPSKADEQGADEEKADSSSAEVDHSEGSAATTVESSVPRKNPSDGAAPQCGSSMTDEPSYTDADASVLMAFANVVIDVPPFPNEVEVQVPPTEETHAVPTEHIVGEDDTMPPQAERDNNGVGDEATADSASAEADHGDGSAATTVKGPLQCPRTRGRQKQTHTDVAARDVPPFPNEEELQVAPTEEAQAVPAEHVVGGDEAMPPHADRDKNGVGEDLKADPPSAEVDHADGSAATTDEGPSTSASTVQRTSGKRRGRPRKQSNVAAPHNTESTKAKTDNAAEMNKNVPPPSAVRDNNGDRDEAKTDSTSAEADHAKGSAATAVEGPSTLASAIQRTSLKRRGRPKKRSSVPASCSETATPKTANPRKADNNVQPPAADRNNSSSDEEDTSIVMEAVHDLVSVSSGKRGDGQANTSPEARRGGDAAAADAEADRSPAEAPHVEETADPTKEDSTASVTTTDNSTRLGPSDFEQPSEPDPDASSVPSAVDSVSGVDIDALDGLCSQMASAGVKASRTEPEPSTSNEAPIHPLPVTGAALTSNRLYGPIVHNDPDELRLDSMALTDQHITVGDDGQNDSSDNNDDAEPMPAVHNADDDASSDGTFEDAPGSPQEQRDVDTGSTVADASSGGEAPGQLRCVMGWTAGQHLEVETLRETNERYQAEKADLQAQLQARTEQNSQLQGHLEAVQQQKDQESAAMREQCEKRLRELQQSADAMVIHWQQRSHDFEQSSHDFEQQCQQLQVELAQAQQAAHDAAQQNAQLMQQRSSTVHNHQFCMEARAAYEHTFQQLRDSENDLREQQRHSATKLREVSAQLQKSLEEKEQVVKEVERLQAHCTELRAELEKEQAETAQLRAAVADARTICDQKCAELETLRTESKAQISKLNTLARRRRLRLERTDTAIKPMKAELRREKQRCKNREALLEIKQEPTVPADDGVPRPSTAEAVAELDEWQRSLEATSEALMQSTEATEASGSQSSSARDSLEESSGPSASDSGMSSSVSPSIPDSPSSNGHSYSSPDAPADSQRSASAGSSEAHVVPHDWRLLAPAPAAPVLRAPAEGARQPVIVADMSVPPPNLIDVRSSLVLSANGGHHWQQHSMAESGPRRFDGSHAVAAQRGTPPQGPPFHHQPPPPQWAVRSRSPPQKQFFPPPISDNRNAQIGGRVFEQSPPNVLEGYGYVMTTPPQSTVHQEPPAYYHSRSPLREGPAAKRPYSQIPTAPNGRPHFAGHHGYRPSQARARSCGPAGGRGGAEESIPPRRGYPPSQNPSDHRRYEEHRGERSSQRDHHRGRWSDGPPAGPLQDRNQCGQPGGPYVEVPHWDRNQRAPPDEGPRPDRSPSPSRGRTDRSRASSREEPVAKRPYAFAPTVDHRHGENHGRFNEQHRAPEGSGHSIEQRRAPEGLPEAEDRAVPHDRGRYRGFGLRDRMGSSVPAGQPANADGAAWWGPEGNSSPQSVSSTGSDDPRFSHGGAENRQPNDERRQPDVRPVGPAPANDIMRPEGSAPQSRTRSNFRYIDEAELLARASGGPSDKRSTDTRPAKSALRPHDGRQLAQLLARQSAQPEGPSVSQQSYWRPANEVILPVGDDHRRPSPSGFQGGFRKRSKSFSDDSDRHRSVRFADAE